MGVNDDFEACPIGTMARLDQLESTLDSIRQWCRAYPVAVFPEPNWSRVNEACQNHGISLSAISGSNMRHVVQGIETIIENSGL
jgi:hypothetical protein